MRPLIDGPEITTRAADSPPTPITTSSRTSQAMTLALLPISRVLHTTNAIAS